MLASLLVVLALPLIDRLLRRLRPLNVGESTANLITWDTRLVIAIDESVVAGGLLDLAIVQVWKLFRSLDIGHVLDVSLGEDKIDLLKGALLGLRVEEVDEWDEKKVHDGEEEVSCPAYLVNHDWHNHDNHEVGNPVDGGGDGVGATTSANWVDLGWVQPWEWEPGGTEEGDVGEETDSGTIRGGLGVWKQAGEDEDHGQALAEGTDEEELAATSTLDDEPGDGSEDRVDNHVDTTQQHGKVVGGVERGLHENWEVVDDGVTSTELLHELGGGTENHATEVLGLAVGEEGAEWGLSTLAAGGCDGVEDNVALNDGLLVGVTESVECGEDAGGLLRAVSSQQPTWRLWKEDDTNAEDETEDDLEGDWESPGEVINGRVRSAVINPVGNHSTDGNNTTLDTDEQTTVGGAGALCLISWDGGSVLRHC